MYDEVRGISTLKKVSVTGLARNRSLALGAAHKIQLKTPHQSYNTSRNHGAHDRGGEDS
jgi:hypothetical protein